MLFFITLSTLQLAIDNPLDDPNTTLSQTLIIIDMVVSAIFIFEAIIKIISNGFFNCGSLSYIRSYWNLLDFAIIVITVCTFLHNYTFRFLLME